MQFAHPRMLWLLAITVPLLSVFLWWSWQRRQFLISQFVRSRLLAHLTVGLSRTIQKIRMLLLVLAVACLILALARPQWGFAWEEAQQRGLDIVVAIDTSRSMLAEDISPNRLQRAKLAALDLMLLAERDRLGLVAFAGTAFLQCPLTLDDEAFRQSLSQLQIGIIPQGGTALAEAIQTAAAAFKDQGDNHQVLVLFTDGEDHDSGAVEAAAQAADRGMRIFTVGVGTPGGELLRERDEQGNHTYVKDEQGNVVKSRLNESLLTEIATAANGFYLPMSGASTVDVLYQRGLAPLPKSEISTKLVKSSQERFQWPLLLAILLLLAEVFLPDRKRVHRTETIVAAANPELRKMVALLALALAASPAFASTSGALRKYESGQYQDAYQEYTRSLERRPEDARLQYNAGAAAYQARKYEDAIRHFSAATTASNPQLQENAYYNLGNSLYRVGDAAPNAEMKAQLWEQSVRQYETALKLNPKDADAGFNLEFVKKKLAELKQQQEQQQQHQQQQQEQSKDQSQPQDSNDNQGQDQQDQQDQDKEKSESPQSKPEQQDSRQPNNNAQDQEQPKEPDSPNSRPEPKENQQDQTHGNAATNASPSAAVPAPGQMSPEQVKQLLDSQKEHEKAMIFIPPDKLKSKRRIFKDW